MVILFFLIKKVAENLKIHNCTKICAYNYVKIVNTLDLSRNPESWVKNFKS